ncbi:MAG TPA: hypothetical protein VKX49_05120 [Bryobacteraceae bacterium]|nr:hypothetical protein [Bryobacteraceae bacterium]
MRRALYQILLVLHPAPFRRQFAAEMLWVFDQAARDGAASGFCLDVAASLGRQWIRQPAIWTASGATLGGVLVLMWATAVAPHIRVQRSAVRLEDLVVIAVISVLAICLTLVTTVAFFHSLRRRRL